MSSAFPTAGAGPVPALSLLGCRAPEENPSPNGHRHPPTGSDSNGHRLPPETLSKQHRKPKAGLSPDATSLNGTPVGKRQAPSARQATQPPRRHRLAEVRQQQGVSQRTIARRLGIDAKTYRRMEDPTANLSLEQLHALQAALDVPLIDLLEEHHTLSRPVEERAKLVKIMKTAAALRDAQASPRVGRLSTMLCEQLVDLMPELKEISGWPQFGARRGQSALGKALRQPIDTSHLNMPD